MKVITISLSLVLLITSCASICNSRYQKIYLNVNNKDQVFIDNKEAKTKKGKYLLKRDYCPKQITIKTEGAKDRNIVDMPYRKSPLYILSWVPFALLYGLPPALDYGPKAYDYYTDISIPEVTKSLSKRDESEKRVSINKVSVDLDSKDIKYRYFSSYKEFLINQDKIKAETRDEEDDNIKIENSVFSSALNDLLKDKGYIDTTNIALKTSYLNNLLINATIKNYTVNQVHNRCNRGYMVYVDMTIDWEILDIYKQAVYSQTSSCESGQFSIIDYDKTEKVLHEVVKDGLESGIMSLMNDVKVQNLLTDKSQLKIENQFDDIILPSSGNYVSNLNEAIQSSVTIKTNDKFGSGFVISNNGYIITNYHVVSEGENFEVITNDGQKFNAEVVRTSKIHDLALLKIDVKDFVPFDIQRNKSFEIGAEVYAIGTPNAVDLYQTVTKGIISGVRNLESDSKLLQIDASINHGNSGGAIVTKSGNVLGVVNAKMTGYSVEGVAFGIPAYEIFDKLKIRFE